jgi:hypothetical protein
LSLHTVFFWPENFGASQKLMQWRLLGPVGGGACTCTRRVEAVAPLVDKPRKQKTRASRNGPCTSHRSMHPRKAPVISKNADFHSTRTVKSNIGSKIAFERVSKRKKKYWSAVPISTRKKKKVALGQRGWTVRRGRQARAPWLLSFPVEGFGFSRSRVQPGPLPLSPCVAFTYIDR